MDGESVVATVHFDYALLVTVLQLNDDIIRLVDILAHI
jgi:hypothetical protein